MVNRYRVEPALRWLLPIVALLVVLGHTCELPAYVNLVASAHPTEDTGHHTHDQAHEAEISCDPVDAVANTSSADVGPVLGAASVVPLGGPLLVRLAITSLTGSTRLPSRPPLFLLHASLLI
jgi:hypothetical protein